MRAPPDLILQHFCGANTTFTPLSRSQAANVIAKLPFFAEMDPEAVLASFRETAAGKTTLDAMGLFNLFVSLGWDKKPKVAAKKKKGGSAAAAAPEGGEAPPAEGGGEEAPPAEGGGEEAPPAEGGGEEAPPAEGGGEEAPPAEGGGEEAPPAEGGGEEAPPATAEGDAPVPVEGGSEEAPPAAAAPAEGGGEEAPPVEASEGAPASAEGGAPPAEAPAAAPAAEAAAEEAAPPPPPPGPPAASNAAKVWAALLPSAPVLGVRVDGAWLVSTLALLKSGFGEPALRFAAKAADAAGSGALTESELWRAVTRCASAPLDAPRRALLRAAWRKADKFAKPEEEEGGGGEGGGEGGGDGSEENAAPAEKRPKTPKPEEEVKVMVDSFLAAVSEDEVLAGVLLKEVPLPIEAPPEEAPPAEE